GKDTKKGQRGSSAKGDDVDVVWELSVTDNGVQLKRNVARMGWVPDKVTLRREIEPLRFERVGGEDWPTGTKELAERLDTLGLPLDMSGRKAGAAIRAAGHAWQQNVVHRAVQYRRDQADRALL